MRLSRNSGVRFAALLAAGGLGLGASLLQAAAPASASGAGPGIAGPTTSQSWTKVGTVTFSTLKPAAPLSAKALAAQKRASNAVNRSLSRTTRATSTSGLTPPVVAPTAISATHPGLVQSWEGINAYTEAQAEGFTFTPPDQGLCTGNGSVFEIVNNAVQVYSATGTAESSTISSNSFFGLPPAYNSSTNQYGPIPTDPTCTYDPSLHRWFVDEVVLSTDPTTGNYTEVNKATLAVSKTSNPMGGYYIYQLDLTDTKAGGVHVNCPCLGDFPKIAVDSHGLTLSTNEYPWSGAGYYGNGFNGAQLYLASKRQLAAGSSSVPVWHWNNTSLTTSGGTTVPGFTLWPAAVPGSKFATAGNGSEYFVSSTAAAEANPTGFTGFSNTIGVYQLSNTASLDTTTPAPKLRGALLSSEVYGEAPYAEQKLGPTPLRDCLAVQCFSGLGPSDEQEGSLDPSDTRPLTVWYANGQLMMALDTVMQVSGNLQAGPAWFVINPSTAPASATLVNQGYIGATGTNVIYPSIATKPTGVGVMGFAIAGQDYYPTQAYLNWSGAGPTSAISETVPGAAPLDDFCQYNYFNCAGSSTVPVARPRYGDYSWASFMNGNVFIADEDVSSNCSFAQFAADPTCGGTRSPYSNWSTRISVVTP